MLRLLHAHVLKHIPTNQGRVLGWVKPGIPSAEGETHLNGRYMGDVLRLRIVDENHPNRRHIVSEENEDYDGAVLGLEDD